MVSLETQSRTGKMLVVKMLAEKAQGPEFRSPIDAEWTPCSSDLAKWRSGLAGASLLVGLPSSASSEFDYETSPQRIRWMVPDINSGLQMHPHMNTHTHI